MKGRIGGEEKAKKTSAILCWALVVKKEGKNVSHRHISKRKQEAEILSNVEKILREFKEEWVKALEDWKNYKIKRLKEREISLLDLYDVKLHEDTEKEQERKIKTLKNENKALKRNRYFRHITNN